MRFFSEGFLASLFHGKFYGFDAAEGVLNDLGIVFLEEILESLSVDGVVGEPVREWSLVAWDLVFGRFWWCRFLF